LPVRWNAFSQGDTSSAANTAHSFRRKYGRHVADVEVRVLAGWRAGLDCAWLAYADACGLPPAPAAPRAMARQAHGIDKINSSNWQFRFDL
jgi:hypothetical protein